MPHGSDQDTGLQGWKGPCTFEEDGHHGNFSSRTDLSDLKLHLKNGCENCFSALVARFRNNPMAWIFGEESSSSKSRASIYLGRLRNKPRVEHRRMMKSMLVKGPVFSKLDRNQDGPIMLLFKTAVPADEWDVLACMFNHLSVQCELFHKETCSICTPTYLCNAFKEAPVHLVSPVEGVQPVIKALFENGALSSHVSFLNRVVIDGNYTRLPYEILRAMHEGKLPQHLKTWIAKLKRFLALGKHTTKFMFATVFFHVQEQMRRLEEDCTLTRFYSDGAARLKELVATGCHLGIALKIRQERQNLGANSDYLLRCYGLFWDRCRLERTFSNRTDGSPVCFERDADGFYRFRPPSSPPFFSNIHR